MKNNLTWLIFGAFIFGVAGFFFSKNMIILLITFIPGLITTIVSQSFGYWGSESLIGSPEVLIATLIFWLIIPWLLYLKYKARKNNGLLLGLIILTLSWPIGVALRFLMLANYKSGYIWVLIMLIVNLLTLTIITFWREDERI